VRNKYQSRVSNTDDVQTLNSSWQTCYKQVPYMDFNARYLRYCTYCIHTYTVPKLIKFYELEHNFALYFVKYPPHLKQVLIKYKQLHADVNDLGIVPCCNFMHQEHLQKKITYLWFENEIKESPPPPKKHASEELCATGSQNVTTGSRIQESLRAGFMRRPQSYLHRPASGTRPTLSQATHFTLINSDHVDYRAGRGKGGRSWRG
jgi:hypothetical protein